VELPPLHRETGFKERTTYIAVDMSRLTHSTCFNHRRHVSHTMHGKMRWPSMTSTAASMHFVIVFNQSSEFSSSCRRCSVSAMGYSMRSEGKHSAIVPAFHDDVHRICIGNERTEFSILIWYALPHIDVISCNVDTRRIPCKKKCGGHLLAEQVPDWFSVHSVWIELLCYITKC
jgi:hypothetical protein